jgi:hypothetical protein
VKRDKNGVVLPLFLIKGKGQDIEKLKKGECYEREKQRGKGKQEGTAEKPQREEKDEEGEEEQVGRTASVVRGQIYFFLTPATISKIPPPMANTPMIGGSGIVLLFSL